MGTIALANRLAWLGQERTSFFFFLSRGVGGGRRRGVGGIVREGMGDTSEVEGIEGERGYTKYTGRVESTYREACLRAVEVYQVLSLARTEDKGRQA